MPEKLMAPPHENRAIVARIRAAGPGRSWPAALFRAGCAIESPDVVSSRVGTGRARGAALHSRKGRHSRSRRLGVCGAASAMLLCGCAGVQSALDPAGRDSRLIAEIGWIMTFAGAAIFLLVLALLTWAIYAPPRARHWLGSRAVVVWGGIAFPVALLAALLVYGLALAGGMVRTPSDPLRIAVVGEQFWWRVHYLGANGEPEIASANEVRNPTGRPVEFPLTNADVIHSFWIPSLDGKLDIIPGRENRLVLQTSRPGIYRGQCAEF